MKKGRGQLRGGGRGSFFCAGGGGGKETPLFIGKKGGGKKGGKKKISRRGGPSPLPPACKGEETKASFPLRLIGKEKRKKREKDTLRKKRGGTQ